MPSPAGRALLQRSSSTLSAPRQGVQPQEARLRSVTAAGHSSQPKLEGRVGASRKESHDAQNHGLCRSLLLPLPLATRLPASSFEQGPGRVVVGTEWKLTWPLLSGCDLRHAPRTSCSAWGFFQAEGLMVPGGDEVWQGGGGGGRMRRRRRTWILLPRRKKKNAACLPASIEKSEDRRHYVYSTDTCALPCPVQQVQAGSSAHPHGLLLFPCYYAVRSIKAVLFPC